MVSQTCQRIAVDTRRDQKRVRFGGMKAPLKTSYLGINRKFSRAILSARRALDWPAMRKAPTGRREYSPGQAPAQPWVCVQRGSKPCRGDRIGGGRTSRESAKPNGLLYFMEALRPIKLPGEGHDVFCRPYRAWASLATADPGLRFAPPWAVLSPRRWRFGKDYRWRFR